MDFKSRFEGKKSYINKRGDIVDPASQEVTPLMKPLQTPSTQQSGLPTAAQAQPYVKFRNQQRNLQE